ncbi:MAG TPA: ABC transporter permease [Bryobacteraceae bacterium]|nr:ABC transporter permease [Bryobacteraceae bacterium]
MLSDLFYRLRALVRRKTVEGELDDELRYHFERQVEKYIASGMSRADAVRRARMEFGGVESVKEECREARGVHTLVTLGQDVRYALRMWRRNPGFTAVAALSLALGIGANTAIFSVLDEVLLRPLPVKNPRELALVSLGSSSQIALEFFGGEVPMSYQLYRTLRDSNSVFSGLLAACEPLSAEMRAQGRMSAASSPQVQTQPVSGNYFWVLGVEPILGRVLTADDDRVTGSGGGEGPVAVISYRFWQRRFGLNPAVVGSSILLNDGRFTIVGVARPGFDSESIGRVSDVWVPVAMISALSPQLSPDRFVPRFTVIGRLQPGVTRPQTQEAMQAILQHAGEDALDGMSPSDVGIRVKDGSKGESNLRTQLSITLIVLMSAVGLVLLIACANVATLLLARAAARRREIAVRLSIGAGRARLVRQLFTESLLLAVVGGFAGVLLARWGAALLVASISGDSPEVLAGVNADVHILSFALAVTIVAALLFGLAPAMQATRVDLTTALNDASRSSQGRRSQMAGRLLIAAQVALTVVLLIGSSLFVRTLRNLESLDIGFNREHTLLVNFDFGGDYRGAKLAKLAGDLERRIRTLPGVLSTGAATTTPFGGNFSGSPVKVPGYVARDDDPFYVEWNLVGADFFHSAGLPMIWGREFGPQDTDRGSERGESVAGPGFVAVVNEAFTKRFFGDRNPVGKHFTMRRATDVEIVGVAKDVKYEGLRKQTAPMIYLPTEQDLFHWRDLSLVVRFTGSPRDAAGLIAGIRSEVSHAAAGVRISAIQTLQNLVDRSLLEEWLAADLSSIASVLALLLVSVGLYGAVAYAVTRRTQELGIRMALGARREDIFWMVLGDTLLTVGAGIVAGVPLGLAAVRLVSAKLFDVRAADPVALAVAILLMISVATVASFLPARRAAGVDPMMALRHE